jgi:cation diffusion facilitator family transporter
VAYEDAQRSRLRVRELQDRAFRTHRGLSRGGVEPSPRCLRTASVPTDGRTSSCGSWPLVHNRGMGGDVTTRRVVVTSFVVDLLDITTNGVVMVLTGSAVIFAEFAQGGADALGSLLLVVGHRRARRPHSPRHPLGHVRESFFWSLLSALTLLLLGGGLTFWRGIGRLAEPVGVERVGLALGLLCVSILTNGYAAWQSVRRLRAGGRPLLVAFRESEHPLVNTALLQDSLGTASSVVGLLAMLLYVATGIVALDAVGALLIGALIVVFALVLVSQARGLIAGRAVPRRTASRILAAARAVPEVEVVNRLTAVLEGEGRIRVDLDLDLSEGLTTTRIEGVLDEVQRAIADAVPAVHAVVVDLNSPKGTGPQAP